MTKGEVQSRQATIPARGVEAAAMGKPLATGSRP